MTLAIWLVLAACTIAVATDVATRRIPNWLTAGLALAALGLHAMQGWAPLGIALLQLVVVMLVGFLAFSMKWLGGGDVKLLAASAAALDPGDVALLLLYTALGGGVLALVVAASTGRLAQVFGSVALVLRPFAYKGTTAVAPRNPIMLPYACAIASGAIAVALSHTAAPFLRLHL
jgi:prepilin peptidase CpaA